MEKLTLTEEIVSVQKYVLLMAQLMCHGNEENAKDMAQETLLKMLQHKRRCRNESNIRAWAYTIMRNTYINFQKRESRLETFSTTYEEIMNRTVNYEIFNETMEYFELLPQYVGNLFFYYMDGYSYADISEMTGISISTVRGRIFTTRHKLQKLLAPYLRGI